jgi:Small-conductance mechanosensitive channel
MYIKYVRFAIFMEFVLLFGCAQPKPQAVIHPVRTIKSIVKAKQNSSLPNAPIGTVRNVRESESVKVYGMNRYVDPVDPRVLHERHAIYRVEEQPHWVTQNDGKENAILLGPILGLRNAQYAPEPLPGETARDLVETKQGLQDANRDIHAIQQNQEKLATAVQSLAEQTLDAQRKLTNVVSTLNGRLQKIEGSSDETVDKPSVNENKVPAGGVVIRKGE